MKKFYIGLLGFALLFSSCSYWNAAQRFGYSELKYSIKEVPAALKALTAAINDRDLEKVQNLMSAQCNQAEDEMESQILAMFDMFDEKITDDSFRTYGAGGMGIQYGKRDGYVSHRITLHTENHLYYLYFNYVYMDDFYPENVGFMGIELLDENFAANMELEASYTERPTPENKYGVYLGKMKRPEGYDSVVELNDTVVFYKKIERSEPVTEAAIKKFMGNKSNSVTFESFEEKFGLPNASSGENYHYFYELDDGDFAQVIMVGSEIYCVNRVDQNYIRKIWGK